MRHVALLINFTEFIVDILNWIEFARIYYSQLNCFPHLHLAYFNDSLICIAIFAY